jgi:hypothetical protein
MIYDVLAQKPHHMVSILTHKARLRQRFLYRIGRIRCRLPWIALMNVMGGQPIVRGWLLAAAKTSVRKEFDHTLNEA